MEPDETETDLPSEVDIRQLGGPHQDILNILVVFFGKVQWSQKIRDLFMEILESLGIPPEERLNTSSVVQAWITGFYTLLLTNFGKVSADDSLGFAPVFMPIAQLADFDQQRLWHKKTQERLRKLVSALQDRFGDEPWARNRSTIWWEKNVIAAAIIVHWGISRLVNMRVQRITAALSVQRMPQAAVDAEAPSRDEQMAV